VNEPLAERIIGPRITVVDVRCNDRGLAVHKLRLLCYHLSRNVYQDKTKPIARSGRKVADPVSRESRTAAIDQREGRAWEFGFCIWKVRKHRSTPRELRLWPGRDGIVRRGGVTC
jgi:hypothetical protein